jgi:tetratricopeptide (TPR) repeat protein
MPQIPLRAYNRKIEGWIDSGQYTQAINHALYILRLYPKYLEPYRLLGSAHLESGEWQEAINVFQRILSSVPDDQVANLGLSIIREDQGYLEQAIWHLERAYEVEPANLTIQTELRRLYSRRDGTAPQKIPLNRGALARMYNKGKLIDQSIAELQMALHEKPGDLHFQVLLAQTFAEVGREAEALRLGRVVLDKLPFCLEANKILFRALSKNSQTQEADIYRGRLIALDPYYTFTSVNDLDPDKVPESAINIDILV